MTKEAHKKLEIIISTIFDREDAILFREPVDYKGRPLFYYDMLIYEVWDSMTTLLSSKS